MLAESRRTMFVASGAPIAAQNAGAAATATTASTMLDSVETRRDGRRDLARRPGPPHDRQAHAELVEAEDRQQREQRDGERAELLGPEDARERDADREACRAVRTSVLRTLSPSARPARENSVGCFIDTTMSARRAAQRPRRHAGPDLARPGPTRVTTAPMPTTAPRADDECPRAAARPSRRTRRRSMVHAAGDARARAEGHAVPHHVVVREDDGGHHRDMGADASRRR